MTTALAPISTIRRAASLRLIVHETVAALRDHHRIHNENRDVEITYGGAHRFDNRRVRQHTRLGGVYPEVGNHFFDLRSHEIGRERLSHRDAE